MSRKWSRREALQLASNGFPLLSLQGLLAAAPHHAAKAKRVVFLFMPGGV